LLFQLQQNVNILFNIILLKKRLGASEEEIKTAVIIAADIYENEYFILWK
tara:strand:- start:5974 stop:6123 length:150 start_codon:yes stop_codon:yes gene_type:complete